MRFGIDLANIHRYENKDSLARRILSIKEFEEYENSSDKATFLATHFASKEAYKKAICCIKEIPFSKIELLHEDSGAPYLLVEGVRWDISISHDGDYVIAMVMEHAS